MVLTQEVISFIKNNKADLVGIASPEYFPRDASSTTNPSFYINDAKAVIMIGLKLVDALWDKLSGKKDVHSSNLSSYLHHYTYDLLDYIAIQTARFLEEKGYDAYPIQARTEQKEDNIFTGYFSFKKAAVAAGLGSIGKNTMLITPQYGPRLRLVAVVTNAPLTCANPEQKTIRDICKGCNVCIDACPVEALYYYEKRNITEIDKGRCQFHMDLDNQCAYCQGVCVLGKKTAINRRKKLG